MSAHRPHRPSVRGEAPDEPDPDAARALLAPDTRSTAPSPPACGRSRAAPAPRSRAASPTAGHLDEDGTPRPRRGPTRCPTPWMRGAT